MPYAAMFVLLLLCLASGCSSEPRLSASKGTDLVAEVDRVAKDLPEEKRERFKNAVNVLVVVASRQAADDSAVESQVFGRLNNKTPDEIIREYDKLDDATKMQVATEIRRAKVEAAELQVQNDLATRALNEYNRLVREGKEDEKTRSPSVENLYLMVHPNDADSCRRYLALVEGKSHQQLYRELVAQKKVTPANH